MWDKPHKRVADRLYLSLTRGGPDDSEWFEDVLTISLHSGIALDRLLWEVMYDLLARAREDGDLGRHLDAAA